MIIDVIFFLFINLAAADNNNNNNYYMSQVDEATSFKLTQFFKKLDVNINYIYNDLHQYFELSANGKVDVKEQKPSELLKSFTEIYDSYVELTYKTAPFYMQILEKHYNYFDVIFATYRKTQDIQKSWLEFDKVFKEIYFKTFDDYKDLIQRLHSPLQSK